jgi:Tol biopolymer transport system component
MLRKSTRFRKYVLFVLFAALIVGCGTDNPLPTQTAVVMVTETAVPTATLVPSHIPQPTYTTSPTSISTNTPTPSATPIPLPLDPMTPFPSVTPDYVEYETKPIFISMHWCCGDGGSETDFVMGRDVPSLIIYGDGQMIQTDGHMGSKTFLETYLTPQEMCQLRQQIEDTGFLEPHDTFFTERDGSMGGGQLSIQVEDIYYAWYSGDVRFLVEDLAAGYQLIRDFRPQNAFTLYQPHYLVLWLEEVLLEENPLVMPWPKDLPPLSELWVDREDPTIVVERDLVDPIYELFDFKNTQQFFQENGTIYSIIARPILPNETPYHFPVFPRLPRDYVPVINCDGEPTIISPPVPTATPTLTASLGNLTGQGRIAFTFGFDRDQEIYVMEADGTNRLRLTNNRFIDDDPEWSPDGQRIAFVSERNRSRDIFVMKVDGTELIQLTDDISNNYSPSWSPDGTNIAFISDRDTEWDKSEIYVMNTDGSDQTRLTFSDARYFHPVWSPDGSKIAFIQEISSDEPSSKGNYVLAILNLDQPTANEEQFLLTFQPSSVPRWSSDSSRIYLGPSLYNSDVTIFNPDDLESQIRTVSLLDVPKPLDWSANKNFIILPYWEPNEGENAIHYSEEESYNGNINIYALDLNSGEVIQITYSEQDETSPALWP